MAKTEKTNPEQSERRRPRFEFRSKYRNFKVLLKSPRFNERGQMIEPGFKCAFENHVYATDDPRVADALREARSFKRDFWEMDIPAVSEAVGAAA